MHPGRLCFKKKSKISFLFTFNVALWCKCKKIFYKYFFYKIAFAQKFHLTNYFFEFLKIIYFLLYFTNLVEQIIYLTLISRQPTLTATTVTNDTTTTASIITNSSSGSNSSSSISRISSDGSDCFDL